MPSGQPKSSQPGSGTNGSRPIKTLPKATHWFTSQTGGSGNSNNNSSSSDSPMKGKMSMMTQGGSRLRDNPYSLSGRRGSSEDQAGGAGEGEGNISPPVQSRPFGSGRSRMLRTISGQSGHSGSGRDSDIGMGGMREGTGHARMISDADDDFVMVSVSPIKEQPSGEGAAMGQGGRKTRTMSQSRLMDGHVLPQGSQGRSQRQRAKTSQVVGRGRSSSRNRLTSGMTSGSDADFDGDGDLILNREGSPTPTCGMAIAAGKLSLLEGALPSTSGSQMTGGLFGFPPHDLGLPDPESPTKPKSKLTDKRPPQLPSLDLDLGLGSTFHPSPFDSPIRPPPGYSRSLRTSNSQANLLNTSTKSILSRARSDSMRVEDAEGSSPSPDSVRQRQGSWIKRSKGSSSVSVLPSPALGGFGEGSLFSPQRMGVRSRTITASSERSDMSSSPPPPDTPIQRGTSARGLAPSRSLGISGIPQPRFSIASSTSSRSSIAGPSGTSVITLGPMPKSKSAGMKPMVDEENSVFLSPAGKMQAAAWSSSKSLRPEGGLFQARVGVPVSVDKPRPYSESAAADKDYAMEMERERQRDMEAETIFGSGKKAISMSDMRMRQSDSMPVGMQGTVVLNKENSGTATAGSSRIIKHRRTGSHHGNVLLFGQKPTERPPPSPFQTITNRPHKKTMSDQSNALPGMSRSFGLKAGLADSAQNGAGDAMLSGGRYGLIPKSASGSSRSSFESAASTSASNLTYTTSSTSLFPDETHLFDDVKPLQAAFGAGDARQVSRKYKGRDSISSNTSLLSPSEEDDPMSPELDDADQPPQAPMLAPRPVRPGYLKRASSYGDDRDPGALSGETPGLMPTSAGAWTSAFGVDFSAARENLGGATQKFNMPDTPVKKGSFDGTAAARSLAKVGHSVSQPILSTAQFVAAKQAEAMQSRRATEIPVTAQKPIVTVQSSPEDHDMDAEVRVLVSHDSSLHSPESGVMPDQSPTVRIASRHSTGEGPAGSSSKKNATGLQTGSVRMGLLRRLSSSAASASSEVEDDDNTPTKASTVQRGMLSAEPIQRTTTPTPAPKHVSSASESSLLATYQSNLSSDPHTPSSHSMSNLAPRQSLPHFTSSKPVRRLNHRQSAPGVAMHDVDIFDLKFVVLEDLGRGAFSQVVKVKDKESGSIYAVKKARGVFEGVKDRLRHLEEVDILRHLSSKPHSNIITFVDAWEQNCQLFIQTDLYLGTLAFFLEEFGRVVERLDEGRAWKICRDLADGINHIHEMGVIHFDLKPDNILISESGCLKIGDFGMASRWPRISAEDILAGSGLGGEVGNAVSNPRITDREGDRIYMAPEMLQGVFTAASDVFSFGLIVLETATNICVPDGGVHWHSIRENDFSIIDFTFLSPALVDLITSVMRGDPLERPSMADIVQHPILCRARALGKEALIEEDDLWLPHILANATPIPAIYQADDDVEMTPA